MPDSVRDYVGAAMAAFRSHSVHQADVDWSALQDSVLARAAGAQTPAATWVAITWALRRVDAHSFLMPPARMMMASAGQMTPPAARSAAPPATIQSIAPPLDRRIGVVVVPPHSGVNRVAYVDSLQSRIRTLDSAGVCGWAVDLRENTGGNMWPMLAGVGPLLGAEVVGSFTNSPAGTEWYYRDGRSWLGGSTPSSQPDGWASVPPARPVSASVPVALLAGPRTSSSGEMTLIAFLGRPNVRSFGDVTDGRSSSNSTVALRDGATMLVTSGYPRDRLGRRYPLSIAPDERVPSLEGIGDDATMRRASAWLLEQPGCADRR